jgi:undecaprenyl pyrophosphate phosphatase UppP
VRRIWPWLLVLAVVNGVGFFKAEDRSTTHSGIYIIGALVAGAILIAIGSWVTTRNNDTSRLAWSGATSIVTSLMIFIAVAPSTSRSCPSAADCDTSFGLGLPFVFLFFFAVYLGLGAATRELTTQVRRRRHSA